VREREMCYSLCVAFQSLLDTAGSNVHNFSEPVTDANAKS
jgi:hypothetical protein